MPIRENPASVSASITAENSRPALLPTLLKHIWATVILSISAVAAIVQVQWRNVITADGMTGWLESPIQECAPRFLFSFSHHCLDSHSLRRQWRKNPPPAPPLQMTMRSRTLLLLYSATVEGWKWEKRMQEAQKETQKWPTRIQKKRKKSRQNQDTTTTTVVRHTTHRHRKRKRKQTKIVAGQKESLFSLFIHSFALLYFSMPVNRNAISAPEPPRYFKAKKYFLLCIITGNLLMIIVAFFSVDIITERAISNKRGIGSSSTTKSMTKTVKEIEQSKVSLQNFGVDFCFSYDNFLHLLLEPKFTTLVHCKDDPLQLPCLWPHPRAALLRRHPQGEHLPVYRLRSDGSDLQCLPCLERLHRSAGRPGGHRLRLDHYRRPTLRPRSGAISTDKWQQRWWSKSQRSSSSLVVSPLFGELIFHYKALIPPEYFFFVIVVQTNKHKLTHTVERKRPENLRASVLFLFYYIATNHRHQLWRKDKFHVILRC